MKKISRTFIPALALILAVLTSCEPDSVSGGRLSSGKPFTFTIGNGSVSSTRGMESRPEVPASSLLCTLESAEEDGDAPTLSITQTVSSLDDEWLLTADAEGETSLTRGTPVFTENLGTFAATTYDALTSTTGTTVYNDVWSNMKDAEFTRGTDKKANVWSHEYTNNERWPEGNGNLTFFMRYPVTATNTTNLSGLEYARVNGKNVINLASYSTPGAANTTTAAETQTDIVFATATLNEKSDSPYGILFYHPFCGVKFKIGNLPAGVAITGVSLSGVYAKGDCVITPYYGNTAAYDKDNSNKKDDNTVQGSKSMDCVAWSNFGPETGSTFGQTFTSSDYNPTLDTSKFPSDFADAGTNTKPNQNQLNTTTLSKTFNLIPQTFTDSHKLTMTISLTYNGVAMQRSTELTTVTWLAGSLYTYTISATDEIDVTVTDEVNGNVKSNVVITNTGNMPEYIRAAIVGCWCDDDGNIVAPWSASQGTFDGLANSTYWHTGSDGYYYYKDPVPAGAATPTALFTTYTAPDAPEEGAHLEITITAQAVIADKNVAGTAWGIDQSIYTQQNQ